MQTKRKYMYWYGFENKTQCGFVHQHSIRFHSVDSQQITGKCVSSSVVLVLIDNKVSVIRQSPRLCELGEGSRASSSQPAES